MSDYFLKPYERLGGNISGKLDLPNYTTRADLKGETGGGSSNLAVKLDLAGLNAELDKIGK